MGGGAGQAGLGHHCLPPERPAALGRPPPPSHPHVRTSAPHVQQGKLGITGLKVRLFLSRVADPHPFYADPGPAFHFNADPDPAFHLNSDPNFHYHCRSGSRFSL